MLRLGIFGDSFGDDYTIWRNRWTDVGPSWIDYLRSKNKYEIENFCVGGTNTYYSKKLFDQHYERFDKIIFVATFPNGRLDLKSLYKNNNLLNLQFFNMNCILRAESDLSRYNDIEKKIIKAVKNYYLYIFNSEYDNTLHNLWLQDMVDKFPSIVIIPAFDVSVPNLDYPALINIVQKEQKYFGLKDVIPAEKNFYDARKCHLCEENNLILGQKIETFLEGAPVKLCLDDFVNPTRNIDYYFREW